MKFKSWKKLSTRQKHFGEAFYNYFRSTGQFTSLSEWNDLPVGLRDGNLPVLHNYISKTLSSLDIPRFKEIPACNRAGKKYYDFLVASVTGAGEVFNITGIINDGVEIKGQFVNPIAGATVICDDETVTTGADGSYSFTGLTPGKYIVKVSAEHYANKQSQVTISNENVVRNIALDRTDFRVSGIVSDDQETPAIVAGAIVTIDGTESCTTDETGAYEFPYIGIGEHTITVTAEGFDDEEATITITDADVTENITLTTTSAEE